MSSLTPRFSMQVSPSCSLSSNSKPYCMPEQPPPWMNTRSFRLGLPSPRIRSPTLRAAESVKVSVSSMSRTLRAGLGRRNRRRAVGLRFCGVGGRVVAKRNQFPRYDGAWRHFNDAVINVAVDPGLFTQNQSLACVHVAVDSAIHHDAGDFHAAFDEAALADRQGPAIGGGTAHVAVHTAIQVQATGKIQIAIQRRRPAQQRVDASGCLFTSPEHGYSRNRSAYCGSIFHT